MIRLHERKNIALTKKGGCWKFIIAGNNKLWPDGLMGGDWIKILMGTENHVTARNKMFSFESRIGFEGLVRV